MSVIEDSRKKERNEKEDEEEDEEKNIRPAARINRSECNHEGTLPRVRRVREAEGSTECLRNLLHWPKRRARKKKKTEARKQGPSKNHFASFKRRDEKKRRSLIVPSSPVVHLSLQTVQRPSKKVEEEEDGRGIDVMKFPNRPIQKERDGRVLHYECRQFLSSSLVSKELVSTGPSSSPYVIKFVIPIDKGKVDSFNIILKKMLASSLTCIVVEREERRWMMTGVAGLWNDWECHRCRRHGRRRARWGRRRQRRRCGARWCCCRSRRNRLDSSDGCLGRSCRRGRRRHRRGAGSRQRAAHSRRPHCSSNYITLNVNNLTFTLYPYREPQWHYASFGPCASNLIGQSKCICIIQVFLLDSFISREGERAREKKATHSDFPN